MARIAGRNAALYINLTSGGTAEPVAFLSKYSINFSADRYEVTAFGDVGKAYVAGLPDAQGDYTGWYDNATVQTYTSAVDGVARKCYLYPDRTNATQYWWGTAFFDMKIDIAVDGAIDLSGTFAAASPLVKVG
jgi:hypothetical protein